MLTIKSKLLVVAVIGSLVLPMAGVAATYTTNKTATFDVSMRIVADCTIAAAGMDFGQNQGLLTTALTASANINVTCTNTTLYNVGLTAGTGTGSTGTTRFMSGAAGNTGAVKFNLYQTPGAGAWGNSQGADTASGTGTGAQQTLTVYGEVPIQNTPAPDSYKSTVTATVYF